MGFELIILIDILIQNYVLLKECIRLLKPYYSVGCAPHNETPVLCEVALGFLSISFGDYP